MRSLKVTNLNEIRNELNKYKKGKKLDIHQFNQVARLAWLGKIVLQPLDPLDPECESALVYVDYPDEIAMHVLDPDEDLVGRIHIVDAEQSRALAAILEKGMQDRVALYRDLARRDFYFRQFFEDEQQGEAERGEGPEASAPGEE